MLSLSKLCAVASGATKNEDLDQQLLLEEDLIMYQEQVPESVLIANSTSPDNMRVFSPKELIHVSQVKF